MESSPTRAVRGQGRSRDRRADPLTRIRAEFDGVHGVWRSAGGEVCVADPEAVRAVMGNRHGTVAETSDFYHNRHGVFGPRSATTPTGSG